MITIRLTELQDLPQVMAIYEHARELMRECGNPNQWINGYPSEPLIRSEIEQKHSYVGLDEEGKLAVTFCFIKGNDPTYDVIYNGEWLNDAPYGVLHRVGTSGVHKGVAKIVLDWCFMQIPNMRIDTHEENLVMQHILEHYGFVRCGIIYVANGTPRIAYQKCQ